MNDRADGLLKPSILPLSVPILVTVIRLFDSSPHKAVISVVKLSLLPRLK